MAGRLVDGTKPVAIFGTGGCGREAASYALDIFEQTESSIPFAEQILFIVDHPPADLQSIWGFPVKATKAVELADYDVVIGVGIPSIRKKIVDKLPKDIFYPSLLHPTAKIGPNVTIGEGAIIAPGCILTCDIELGKHIQLNIQTTITHDCKAGDFFTTAPGVRISGNNTFGEGVYLGTGTTTKQGITCVSDVVVGMNAGVVKDLLEPGNYVGTPASLLSPKSN